MARVCLGRRSRGAYLGEVSIAGRCARSGSHALLALVKQPELGPLVGVDDGEDLGDTLADVVNAGELGVGTLAVLSEINSLGFRQHASLSSSSPESQRTT
jgi:hypothetical protein